MTIPYGLRRYPLMVALFLPAGVGMAWWGLTVTAPTFVFPFGLLDPGTARAVLCTVAAATWFYVGVMTWVRFVRRPSVVLGDTEIVLPRGEFGGDRVVLHPGDVQSVTEHTRPGGWRTMRVVHRGGVLDLASSQLPDDAAYERVAQAMRAFVVRP